MENIIEINDLTFFYPDGKKALDSIQLTVKSGEKIGIIGANGAGKSTLLYHLNGIFTGSGKIKICGLDCNKWNIGKIRASVGVVFQNPDDQLFSQTVFDDVAYGPIYQGFDRLLVKEKVERALHAVNMIDYLDRTPYHLSSGEKKRIAIATVLSMEPEILVLDEPTAGLDPRSRRQLIELLYGMHQTILIATHDLDLAELILSRMIILDGGKIVADGKTKELLSDKTLLTLHGLV